MRGIAGILMIACLCGCSSPRDDALQFADQMNLQRQDLSTDQFTLASWRRVSQGADVLYVYLEGDGRAWVRRSQPSSDPTPRIPTALMLASRDQAASVAYLARPCQYVSCDTRSHQKYWTSARFSPEVIGATRQAIQRLALQFKVRHVVLIGYSGGGVLATLVAAQEPLIKGLITVAAPLDVATWTRYHGVSPLTNSASPIDAPGRLLSLPQVHLVGEQDAVVPQTIVQSYLRAVHPRCARIITKPHATHVSGWVAHWQRPPVPRCVLTD